MDLIDIYRGFHPKINENYLFCSAYETFSRTDHMLRPKTSLKEYVRTEIISNIFKDLNAIKFCKLQIVVKVTN